MFPDRRSINEASIYVCSAIAFMGILGNFVSFLVFIRSGRRNPRIVTRNLLLLLTITNSTYLVLYWLHSILPRIIDHYATAQSHSPSLTTQANSTNQNNKLVEISLNSNNNKNVNRESGNYFLNSFDFILTTKNLYSCRLITYMINVAICLNATVTVSFSIERAVAINFPFATRNLRENYKLFFKYLVVIIVIFSFVFPVYNLFLLGIITNKNSGNTRCDVLANNEQLYFMLTLILVVITLAIPFLLITVSNISVLLAVYKSNRSMVERMGSLSDSGYAATALTSAVINIGDTKVGMEESAGNTSNNNSPSSSPVREIHRQMSTNKNNNANKTAMVSSSDGSLIRAGTVIMSKKRRSVRRSRDKNSKITTMLLAISASFVLLNFPYFLAWCNYAYSRVVRQNIAFNTNRVISQLNSTTTTTISPYAMYLSNNATSEMIKPVTVVPTTTTTTSQANISFAFMRITEALNLLNYAINGFLYFSTGKLYREHLLFLLGCKYAKSNSF